MMPRDRQYFHRYLEQMFDDGDAFELNSGPVLVSDRKDGEHVQRAVIFSANVLVLIVAGTESAGAAPKRVFRRAAAMGCSPAALRRQ